jgi:hypothetical protein
LTISIESRVENRRLADISGTFDGMMGGFQAKPMTWIGEGEDVLAAYHDLNSLVVR